MNIVKKMPTVALSAETAAAIRQSERDREVKTLSLAVLKQAANDYISAKKYLATHSKSEETKERYHEMKFLKEDVERFFLGESLYEDESPMFELYLQGDVSGEDFLNNLNRYIEKNGYTPIRVGYVTVASNPSSDQEEVI
jgi:hypothetical protein